MTKGLDPIVEGMNNFNNPLIEIETLAESRALACINCPIDKCQLEPIESLRVTDIRIPALTDMFCDLCGCTLSYKLRQSIDKCKLWEQ